MNKCHIRTGMFSCDSQGRRYLCLVVELKPQLNAIGTSAVGIDLGLMELLTCSDGVNMKGFVDGKEDISGLLMLLSLRLGVDGEVFNLSGVESDLIYHSLSDALSFLEVIPDDVIRPSLSYSDDGEVVFTWVKNDLRAEVAFLGDSSIEYTYRIFGRFVPGKYSGTVKGFPSDLRDYLTGGILSL